jgi:plastocyanin
MNRIGINLAMLTCLAMAGCDQSSSATSTSSLPTSVAGNGVVRGSIQFVGKAPEMKTFTATEACCRGEPPIVEETVIANSNGTLRNVFVFIEGAPRLNGAGQPAALLDQSRCAYVPHALGVQIGQTLNIRSSDPTMHNVHFNPTINAAHNYAMTQVGQEVKTTFSGAEFIRMKCDVHPWMTAWVGVFDNPFYAVTKEDGSFEIKGIPAGNYTLVSWHELYGRQEQSVTIADDKPIEMTFSFGARG